ncbi:MAG: hypothetical protein JWO62_489 [Acidimicrobiaceae bacterium]|jgi:hypothetical protein|nr:hypothetical protein [Acidimicrobiaceae bacterium]
MRLLSRSVEANARLTSAAGAVLLVLFCVEIATVALGVTGLLTLHVMIGLLLAPPLFLKIASVSWRLLQYYRHDPQYQRRGPPPPALRALGPVLLLATLVLLSSGITLLLAPSARDGSMRHIHSVSFYLWLVLVLVHVVAHIGDLRRVAPRDLARRTRAGVPGALLRQAFILASLAVGLVLALSLVSRVGAYRHDLNGARSASSHGFGARRGDRVASSGGTPTGVGELGRRVLPADDPWGHLPHREH